MSDPARQAAIQAIDRILRSGAYSNVLTAKTEGFEAGSHAHFQRLVYSTLRWLPFTDRCIASATSGRKLDAMVEATLRVAITDSVVLGTPDHAVASEYVDLARQVGAGRAAGFINGVLRTIFRSGVGVPHSVEDAYPAAVIDIARSSLGDDADAFLLASNEPAAVGVFGQSIDFGHLGIPQSAYVASGQLEGLRESHQAIQVIDPASAAVALAAEVKPGDRVLDVAAAPGGKTLVLKERAGPEGWIVASDLHERRARSGQRRSSRRLREDVAPTDWIVADGRSLPFPGRSFDRVLLDAPCTGLGTLRRRPEIRYRFESAAAPRYGALQRAMLETAIEMVKPGGRLVYSVCTITSQETVEVIDGLGFGRPAQLPGEPMGEGLLMAPHTTGTDGMFLAVLDR